MIGMPRGDIIGKTARELFPAAAADLIERRDQQLLAQASNSIPSSTRMIEDRTDQANVANVAA
jgi:hypothetical protein